MGEGRVRTGEPFNDTRTKCRPWCVPLSDDCTTSTSTDMLDTLCRGRSVDAAVDDDGVVFWSLSWLFRALLIDVCSFSCSSTTSAIGQASTPTYSTRVKRTTLVSDTATRTIPEILAASVDEKRMVGMMWGCWCWWFCFNHTLTGSLAARCNAIPSKMATLETFHSATNEG